MSSVFTEIFGAQPKEAHLGRKPAISALQCHLVTGKQFQEMVRSRLRERTPNYTTFAKFMHASASTMQKKFREGGASLCLDFLFEATSFYQMSVSEMTALPGSLWQEIKPDEAQLLAHFRQLTYTQRQGLLAVLEGRHTPPETARKSRWPRLDITDEQQLVVDLYARSEPEAREGVLKILKGTAKKTVTDGRSPSDDTNE